MLLVVSLEGGALRGREARRKLGVCELLLQSTPGNQLTLLALNSWVGSARATYATGARATWATGASVTASQ